MEPDNDNDTAAVLDADAENAILRAALAAGAQPPSDPVELAAWAHDHVAQRLDGGVTILPSGLPDDGMSSAQRAVLHGNPSLPLGIHRQVMTQAPRATVDTINETMNEMHDDDYRRELWAEFHDRKHNPIEADGRSSLQVGLEAQARYAANRGIYSRLHEHEVPGDIFG
ncbi:hypothetical protein F4X33_10510 [Candidatus Poribacteria bacterium]|nr:hypothetical protein [Candidatus Poribacteria bacterium]